MSLEYAILGFLDRQPMTGYDLKTRCFDRAAAAFWTADQAQVYRTLERLERTGLVTSETVPQPGRPDRKVFAVTGAGRNTLREWLRTPHPLSPLRDPLLLQLHLAAALPDDALRALLETARDSYQRRLDRLRREGAPARGGTAPDGRAAISRDGAIAQARAAIDWIDDELDRISAGNTSSSEVHP
jgi:PadR family transcriptional regulator AphA